MDKFFQVVKEGAEGSLEPEAKLPLDQNNPHTTEAHLGVAHCDPPQHFEKNNIAHNTNTASHMSLQATTVLSEARLLWG